MSEIVLSILICSLEERKKILSQLLQNLFSQCPQLTAQEGIDKASYYIGTTKMEEYYFEGVEVIVATDNREIKTGQKRNLLMLQAKGKYVIYSDDDDILPDYYVEELLKAAESDADCFGMTGIMTTNGVDEKKWIICLGCPYTAERDENGKEFYKRFPNHITGIKREIANKFPFPEVTVGEDYQFASAMRNADALKTEYKIERHPMYIYDYRTNK
jgi:cellulose synthase/poly-beta-1,6-N-acetylglucosamine synthase-like glycosyltransferase